MLTAHRTSTALAIASLFVLLLSAPADAGQFVCKSRTMTSRDHAAMKSVAKHAFAPHVIDWKSLHACMNPGSGRTWMQGIPEPQPDGTVVEPGVECERKSGPWRCEVGVGRSLLTTSAVGDRQQPFELSLPEQFSVDGARRMLARTIELARNLGAQPVCGEPAGQISAWQKDVPNWEAEVRQMPPDAPVQSSIYEHDGTTTVSLGGFEFDFDGTTGDVDARKFRCWGVPVVVT